MGGQIMVLEFSEILTHNCSENWIGSLDFTRSSDQSTNSDDSKNLHFFSTFPVYFDFFLIEVFVQESKICKKNITVYFNKNFQIFNNKTKSFS